MLSRLVTATSTQSALARSICIALVIVLSGCNIERSQSDVPELRSSVNDFAQVIGPGRAELEQVIASLFADTRDVIVVATVRSMAPFRDIRDYSMRVFRNNGRGIGDPVKHNGILVLLVMDENEMRISTGLGMETIISNELAAQIVKRMVSKFSEGRFDDGLILGVKELADHIRAARSPH